MSTRFICFMGAVFVVFFLVGCSGSAPATKATSVPIDSAAQPTSTPEPTSTSSPEPTFTYTVEPTATLAPTKTPSPTITPTPSWPLSLGNLVPEDLPAISPKNVNQLQEVAQWGEGMFYHTGFLADGMKIYTVSTTGLRVHDTDSLDILVYIDEEINNQFTVKWAISPDENWFAVINHDYEITIWSLHTGELELSKQFDKGYLGCVDSISFSPDSSRLAIFGECDLLQYSSRLTVIDLVSGREVMHEEGRGRT
ncbi:MAG: WD40 repeat domain-containing protein [Anaerolineales bacterium]|jgi:hypothetical protein